MASPSKSRQSSNAYYSSTQAPSARIIFDAVYCRPAAKSSRTPFTIEWYALNGIELAFRYGGASIRQDDHRAAASMARRNDARRTSTAEYAMLIRIEIEILLIAR